MTDLPESFRRAGARRRQAGFVLILVLLAAGAAATAQTGRVEDELADVLSVSRAFKRVVKQVTPAVVSIKVVAEAGEKMTDEEKEIARERLRQHLEGKIDPKLLEQLLARIDNDERAKHFSPGVGSGVIIDAAGYIVTNNHVAGGRKNITVVLADEREFPARIIGADPKSDLALLKIDAPGLTALALGDSDALEVGDWVIAVGAPFGLAQTVTHGIISAKGRKHVQELDIKYQDFLQTDAAVNPGNSGGPLVNLRCEVVGINTAIATESGVNEGIAFSIPASMVKKIISQLKEGGAVKRGWLGVGYVEVTKEDRELFGLPEARGVIVSGCVPGAPAEQAGVQVEDVILSVNGRDVAKADDFRDWVAELSPGQEVTIRLFRNGAPLDVSATIGLQPTSDPRMPRSTAWREVKPLEIFVRSLRPSQAREFDGSDHGVLLAAVAPGSPVNVDVGQLLVAVNGQPVRNAGQLIKLVADSPRGEKMKLEFLNTTGDRTIKWVTPK